MRAGNTKRLAAAVLWLAPTTAFAADYDETGAPRPFEITIGSRYWYSSGETSWNHDASGVNPDLGNPTSVLTYDGLDAHAGELFGSAQHETGWLIKGYLGIGGVVSGSLDDEDYFDGQEKFSDTFSTVDNDDLTYGSIDIGRTIYNNHNTGLSVSAFAGYHYWNEVAPASGIRCNPDDVGGAFCGAPGSVPVPFSTNVITNDMTWHSLRIGLAVEAPVTERISLAGEAAFVPYAQLSNADSHHLRGDLGPVPNIHHDGTGYGIQLEGVATYRLTNAWSLGLGARYWHLRADGDIQFGNPPGEDLPLNEFTSSRYGVFVQSSLKF